MVRFDGVHTFGYNSAGSEPIWMKFGAVCAHCLRLAVADFGRDPRRSESEANFCFFFVRSVTHDFADFRLPKFHEICTQVVNRWVGESFPNRIVKFPRKGLFKKNCTFLPKSSTTSDFRLLLMRNITDRRKLRMSTFHFYRWNQL